MKRIISTVLFLVIALFSIAWAEGELDASLIAKARETTLVMHELAGMESLTGLYTINQEIQSRIRAIAEADYGQPESAMVFAVPDARIANLLALMQVDAPEGSDLFRVMKSKLYNTVPTMLNARANAFQLGTTSMLGVTDVYLPKVSYDGIAYVLFLYAGEQPNAVCAFNINGDIAAIAGSFLDTAAFDSVDWSADASDLLKRLLGTDLPIDVSGIAITRYSKEELNGMN